MIGYGDFRAPSPTSDSRPAIFLEDPVEPELAYRGADLPHDVGTGAPGVAGGVED